MEATRELAQRVLALTNEAQRNDGAWRIEAVRLSNIHGDLSRAAFAAGNYAEAIEQATTSTALVCSAKHPVTMYADGIARAIRAGR